MARRRKTGSSLAGRIAGIENQQWDNVGKIIRRIGIEVTWAKIAGIMLSGDSIESSNFIAGDSGWQIDGDGNIEANNLTARGLITTIDQDGGSFIIRDDDTDAILVSLSATVSEFTNVIMSYLEVSDIWATGNIWLTGENSTLYVHNIQWTPPFLLVSSGTPLWEYPRGKTIYNIDNLLDQGFDGIMDNSRAETIGWLVTDHVQYEGSSVNHGVQFLYQFSNPQYWTRSWDWLGNRWSNWFAHDLTDTGVGATPGADGQVATFSYAVKDYASYRPSGWRVKADNVRQGSWNFGEHIGCATIDWAKMQADLAGKTIVEARITIRRYTGGYGAPRPTHLWSLAAAEVNGSNNLVKSGQPALFADRGVHDDLGASSILQTMVISSSIINDIVADDARGIALALTETLSSTGGEDQNYMVTRINTIEVDYQTVIVSQQIPSDGSIVGVTDDVTYVLASIASEFPTEAVGVTDSVTRVHTATRTPTEAVGVADNRGIQASDLRLAYSDDVGVTDDIAPAKSVVVEISETLGITDDTVDVLN